MSLNGFRRLALAQGCLRAAEPAGMATHGERESSASRASVDWPEPIPPQAGRVPSPAEVLEQETRGLSRGGRRNAIAWQ